MLIKDIKKITNKNDNFRKVLYTGKHAQVVLMSIENEIGMEVHPTTDQIIFITSGVGEAIINGESEEIYENYIVFVPAGSQHNFVNKGEEALKLYTIYTPPAHPDGIIEKTKEEAITRER